MNFLSVFLIILGSVVLAVPAFVLRKLKMFPENAAKIFATFLLYVSQPFLVMKSLVNKEFRPEMLVNCLWIVAFGAVIPVIIFLISKLIFRKKGAESANRVCAAASYLGNVGFMGIPILQMMIPGNDEIVLYTAMYTVVFNFLVWTLGVYSVTGDVKTIKLKKLILNPTIIITIVSLPFFFCNVHIPEQVMKPIGFLGDMTLPLSMTILGTRLADTSFLKLVNNVQLYIVSFMKLVAFPLLTFAVIMLLKQFVTVDANIWTVLFVVGAMPTAASVLSFSEVFGEDCETAATATLQNTILCVLTIPILMLLSQYFV